MNIISQLDEIENEVINMIKRCEINHVICKNYNFINKSIEDAREYLSNRETNEDKKIDADLIHFFNNIEDVKNNLVKDEGEEEFKIGKKLRDGIINIKSKTIFLSEKEHCIYELNDIYRKIIPLLDSAIDQMNYYNWLGIKNPNANLGVLFLLLNKEYHTFQQFNLNIDSTKEKQDQIKRAFSIRKDALKIVREELLDIYRNEIFYPAKSYPPKYNYKCNHTEICELIFAIEMSNKYFEEPHLIAQTLRQIFNISVDDYNKNKSSILRKKDRSSFLPKLINQLDTIKIKQ